VPSRRCRRTCPTSGGFSNPVARGGRRPDPGQRAARVRGAAAGRSRGRLAVRVPAHRGAPGRVRPARTGRQELEQALALWRGPAYAEFADEEWATAEVVRLTEQHLAAQEAWAEVALRTGAAAEAVPAAEALIRQQPLREGSWRLLALSLWACNRQADALAALRRARRMLRDELGLEPGPALAEVEEAILGQRQELLHRVQPLPAAPASRAPAAPASHAGSQTPDELFVGRGDELRAIAAAAARHAGGVVLITGEGGAGKTRLLDRAVAHLAEAGWTVVTGSCPDAGGAPSASACCSIPTHGPPAPAPAPAPAPVPAPGQMPRRTPRRRVSGSIRRCSPGCDRPRPPGPWPCSSMTCTRRTRKRWPCSRPWRPGWPDHRCC
jgi:hypothetical protein